jgi:uncharacterized membrane protein YwzB
MNVKILLYIFIGFVVLFAMDSLNINGIFKKNRVIQARVLYFMIFMSLTYLVTNFIYDLFISIVTR